MIKIKWWWYEQGQYTLCKGMQIERRSLSLKCPFQSHAQMQMVHTVAKEFQAFKKNTFRGKFVSQGD